MYVYQINRIDACAAYTFVGLWSAKCIFRVPFHLAPVLVVVIAETSALCCEFYGGCVSYAQMIDNTSKSHGNETKMARPVGHML